MMNVIIECESRIINNPTCNVNFHRKLPRLIVEGFAKVAAEEIRGRPPHEVIRRTNEQHPEVLRHSNEERRKRHSDYLLLAKRNFEAMSRTKNKPLMYIIP